MSVLWYIRTMLVYQCDKCKRTLSDQERAARISVGIGYESYEFCPECGTRIADILELTLNS